MCAMLQQYAPRCKEITRISHNTYITFYTLTLSITHTDVFIGDTLFTSTFLIGSDGLQHFKKKLFIFICP